MADALWPAEARVHDVGDRVVRRVMSGLSGLRIGIVPATAGAVDINARKFHFRDVRRMCRRGADDASPATAPVVAQGGSPPVMLELVLSVLCATMGSTMIYLAAPAHTLHASALRHVRVWRWSGLGVLSLSLLLLGRTMRLEHAAFAWSAIVMLVLSVAPFCGAWIARRRSIRS